MSTFKSPFAGLNRVDARRERFRQDSGICMKHDLQIKRGTLRCQRCRKLARKRRPS